ncbi:MAG: amidohydrolase family protein [Bacteroidia bacterium]
MQFKLTTSLCLILLIITSIAKAQNPAPAKSQTKKILLAGGTVHVGNGQVIDNAAIGFANGKITYIGTVTDTNAADYDTVINCTGKHIYPGFIGMNTTMGLAEIEAVRATRDIYEVGDLNPSARAIIAYNTDNKTIPTVRCDGVLLCQIVPQGGLISGQSSVVELDAWNWEDAAYKTDEGIHLNWPNMRVYSYTNAPPIEEQQDRTQKVLTNINQLFKDARAYYATAVHEETNLNLEVMRGLFDGTKKLYVHADYVREIIAAVNFCKEQKIKMILVGGDDAYKATDLLKENHIPVVLGNTHSLPRSVDDDIDQPFKTPALLQKAGVDYCISVGGFWQVRTLGFQAGQAVPYGITKEQALAAITSAPAKILGIDKTTGTLETGKDATLFISKGDALDMLGNKIDTAFIRGKLINLDNVQKQLYKKYMDKYGLKE